MSEPSLIGGGPLPVIRIPKICPDCGSEYEGNAITPLRPGEERRIHRCESCLDVWEAAQKNFKQRTGQEVSPPVTELKRPQRTLDIEEDRYGS